MENREEGTAKQERQYKQNMKRRVIGLLLVIGMAASIAGCTKAAPPAPARDSIFAVLDQIGNTLDAAVANLTNITIVTGHIYDKIIGVDENFNYEAAVATSWKQVDPVTFTFTVGDKFKFQNGEPLEMADVIYSIERLRTVPKCAYFMSNIKSVTATGPKEVTIKLNEANSSTIRSLMGVAQVYNKSYCESAGADYANKPIGTGPYMVKSFTPGDKLELTRWEDYPFAKPAIKNITFKVIAEAANRYISLETGEAQFGLISYQDMDRASKNAKLTVAPMKTTNTAFISMNNKKAPFDNKNVRLAMACATDKQGLAAIQGGSTVIDSMSPTMFSTYYSAPNVPKFDQTKAKQLLEAEGYNASHPLKFETWVYGGNTSIMEAFQGTLKTIGVEMTITNLEFGVFLEGLAKGEYQMLSGSWNNVTGDPLVAISNYWTGSFGSQNISFFDNKRTDELYNIAKAAPDEATLKAAAKEVQEIAASEMPIIPTYSSMANFVMDKQLQGVRIYPSSVYSFRTAHY